MQKLRPLQVPLSGTNLIEASAGTGKTYTITTLYLRLLLGLAQPGEATDGLSVEQVLVVTFTEAATEEIRDRVRKRLSEAKQAIFFRDVKSGAYKPDPVLAQLIEQIPDHDLAFRRLDAAIKMMDEACIFTIHGFCQRMLKFHAFESGSLFDNQFILDEKAYLQNAIKDFWRRNVYPLSGLLLDLFLQHWAHPDKMLQELMPLLNKQGVRALKTIDEQQLFEHAGQYGWLSEQVKRLWLDEQIPALINDCLDRKVFKKNVKSVKPEYLEAFTEFCLSDEQEFLAGKDSWELWSPQWLNKACTKGSEPPEHRIWSLFERLAELRVNLKSDVYAFFKHKAFEQVKALLLEQKRLEQKISPDDLLSNLAAALKHQEKGATLASKIARQFPVAMIDEFQDTDPLQYEIFSTIYNQKDSAMVMIGDPKQAIYGFRGADIFTYIQAKHDVSDEHRYTLDINWRSASNLVSAINGLFQFSKDPFIYNDTIEFHPVEAAPKADSEPLLVIGERNSAPLQLWHLQGENGLPVSKSNAAETLAQRSANQIAELLQKAQDGQATIGDRPLVAGDICVLVRDRNEAEVIRQALTRTGVPSVYLSRQSVFETALAFEFYLLLDAIVQVKNEKAIRAALTTAFFGYSFNQLWLLSQNEDDWQGILDLFEQLHKLMLRNGSMAVLQHLLLNNDLARRWRKEYKDVQRKLTDIRHICELLQQKSLECDGVNRLMVWFHEQLNSAKDEGKVQQLRLEDDANLVQIVTMHASKGLEYNIVFMPLVCGYRPAQLGIFHDEEQGQVVDFANQKDNLAKADKERLAEDLRLLYVALTRAVHRCYVGVFNLKVGNSKASHLQQTALGYLLFNDESELDDERIYACLNDLCLTLNSQTEICQLESFDRQVEVVAAVNLKATHAADAVFNAFSGTIETDWRVTSYSALAHGVTATIEKPGGTDEGEIIVAEPLEVAQLAPSPFTFPKGANAGSCLHEILENIEFTGFVKEHCDDKAILTAFAKFGIDEGFAESTKHWMASVLNTRLNRKGMKLNAIAKPQRLVEMEFYLPITDLTAESINQILSEHIGRKVEHFNFAQVQGILKGYIDLICQWQDQYFVVDYKSNHLGDSVDDYEKKQMSYAMEEHHYHLQYLLYTLALHRYLQKRLKDYDYDRHFGGCYYLFLRGMDERNSHFEGIYFSRPEKALIEKLDRLFKEGERIRIQQDMPAQLGLFGGPL